MTLPPVTWRPSPFHNVGRGGYGIRAEVKHRIVGSLPSARGAFGVDPNAGQPRSASTHFGIGHTQVGAPCPECGAITGARGELVVDQYVDLADMAWGNGDVREPSWPLLIAGVNPNLYTVSTEHEDMSTAGRGVVTDHIRRASIELSRVLRSGDRARLEAAGIRCRDDAVIEQLAAMPIDELHYIDHHQISGPNKPYCWRAWLDDVGFMPWRDELLAALASPEEEELETVDIIPPDVVSITLLPGATIRERPAWDAPLLYEHELDAEQTWPRATNAIDYVAGPAFGDDGSEWLWLRMWIVDGDSGKGRNAFVNQHFTRNNTAAVPAGGDGAEVARLAGELTRAQQALRERDARIYAKDESFGRLIAEAQKGKSA